MLRSSSPDASSSSPPPPPPPLYSSPALRHPDRAASTRDSTPVTTPLGFGVPSRSLDSPSSNSSGPPRPSIRANPDHPDHARSPPDCYFSIHHRPSATSVRDPDDPAVFDDDFELFCPLPPLPGCNHKMSASPIDIATRTSVSPPGQQASNLTSALQKAGNGDRSGSLSHANGSGIGMFRPPPPRKDSVGTATAQWGNGSKPISVSGSNRELPRRESLAGSLLGGMSWGGVSVGSFIRDDILMTGTSPFTFQSPSFHSSSYMPKLEADFMKDFSCCGVTLPSLHDLLQHYEEAHATKSPNQGGHRPSQADTRAALAAALVHQHQPNSTPNRGLQPDRTIDLQRKLSQNQPSQQHDLDTMEDMELDDAMADSDPTPSQLFSPQARDGAQGGFGNDNQRVPNLNLSMLPSHQGFQQSSQPGTPVGPGRPLSLQNNPTVSSVNTPTLMANPLQNSQFRATPDSSAPGTPAELDESMLGGFGDLTMQNNPLLQGPSQFRFTGNNDMLDLCIDEPAKRLFSPNGGLSSNAHFKLSGAQYGPNSDIAQRIRDQQLAAGVPDTTAILPNEEPKPFRCPVIGCEKAYKNQNGLKYHKAHGHNNQQLHDNADGTFSIVNPETSTPYPGTMGMEKEKPYRCEVCGKRYKNLNGLKYHKSHSPPCNPDYHMPGRNLFAGGVMQGQNINVAGAGLPGIGEEGLL